MNKFHFLLISFFYLSSSVVYAQEKAPSGKRFLVSNVVQPKAMLETESVVTAFEAKLHKKISYYPTEFSSKQLVYCANNGLIETLQQCYDQHRPLILSPDIIWLAICQGTSIHINQHFKDFESVIFKKDKPNEIVINNDSLEFGEKHWQKLINDFSRETQKYTQDDYYNFFVPAFSTTTAIEQRAYQITMLEAFKKAFTYIGETGCGIPNITLTGSKKDWLAIYNRLDQLDKIGLSEWRKELKPIVQEFINVYDDKINMQFWQSIYKSASTYGAVYVSGWIVKLYPYIKEIELTKEKDSTGEKAKAIEKILPNQFLKGNSYRLSTLQTDNFPSGIAKIDIIWKNYYKQTTETLEACSGFMGIRQYQDKSLMPVIAWALCKKDAQIIEDREPTADTLTLNIPHKKDYWSPLVCDKLVTPAQYDIRTYKTHQEGIDYIRKRIENAILNNKEFKQNKLSNIKVKLIILTNGDIADGSIKCNNKMLADFVRKEMTSLPGKWTPALAYPQDFFDEELTEQEMKLKVRVNSKVEFTLFIN
ncbi:DUF4419 domain-containing protein [Parabacteroides sp. FAFU027]|uniref:DUF4419 domain-containing protein n=1 Tax=Parabacteroides sp. FAFU027 TaxID=2922715 RepID=UPI001FAF6950|nr:DUF4419 domain-containing protein [Parabacteroides sp. FAFU027]